MYICINLIIKMYAKNVIGNRVFFCSLHYLQRNRADGVSGHSSVCRPLFFADRRPSRTITPDTHKTWYEINDIVADK